MEIVTTFILGVLVGVVVVVIMNCSRMVGSLRLDRSDPDEEPYLFLELTKSMRDVVSRKHVILRVDVRDFLPRK